MNKLSRVLRHKLLQKITFEEKAEPHSKKIPEATINHNRGQKVWICFEPWVHLNNVCITDRLKNKPGWMFLNKCETCQYLTRLQWKCTPNLFQLNTTFLKVCLEQLGDSIHHFYRKSNAETWCIIIKMIISIHVIYLIDKIVKVTV